MHTLNFFSQQVLLHPLKWRAMVLLKSETGHGAENFQNCTFLSLSSTINLFKSVFSNRAWGNYFYKNIYTLIKKNTSNSPKVYFLVLQRSVHISGIITNTITITNNLANLGQKIFVMLLMICDDHNL